MEKVILYSCVLLSDKSHSDLVSRFADFIKEDWKVYAHHMTINMGELSADMKSEIGKTVTLKVTDVGISDKAVAFKVDGYYSKNAIPHVTLAVNVKEGGKPQMSNDIQSWFKLSDESSIQLTGVVTEIEK